MSDLNKKIVDFSNWNLWFYPVQMIIGFASSVYVTRIFGVRLYGELSVYLALSTLFAILSDLGVSAGITKFFPEFQARRARFLPYFAAIILARLCLLSLAGIAAIFFPQFFIQAAHWQTSLLPVILATVLLQIFVDLIVAGNLAMLNNKPVQIAQTIGGLILPVLIFAFVTRDLKTILTLYFAAMLVKLVYLAATFRWSAFLFPGGNPGPPRIWKRSLNNTLAKILFVLLRYGFDLGFLYLLFAGDEFMRAIGLVSLANRFLAQMLNFSAFPLNQMQDTLFAHLYVEKENRERIQKVFNLLTKYYCLFTTPLLLFLIGSGKILIVTFYGREFLPSYFYLAVLSAVMAASTFYGSANKMLVSFEEHAFFNQVSAATFALMALLLLAARHWQAFDAAFLGIAVLRFAYHFVTHRFLTRKWRLRLDRSWVSRILLANTVWLAPLFLTGFAPARDGIILLLCALAYGLIQKKIGLITREDKNYFLQLKLPFKERLVSWL